MGTTFIFFSEHKTVDRSRSTGGVESGAQGEAAGGNRGGKQGGIRILCRPETQHFLTAAGSIHHVLGDLQGPLDSLHQEVSDLVEGFTHTGVTGGTGGVEKKKRKDSELRSRGIRKKRRK